MDMIFVAAGRVVWSEIAAAGDWLEPRAKENEGGEGGRGKGRDGGRRPGCPGHPRCGRPVCQGRPASRERASWSRFPAPHRALQVFVARGASPWRRIAQR